MPWQRELGEGPDSQEREGAIAEEGKRRSSRLSEETPCARACAHAHGLSEGGMALAQATGGEKPLAHLRETGRFLCRLPVARHLLCGLKALGG